MMPSTDDRTGKCPSNCVGQGNSIPELVCNQSYLYCCNENNKYFCCNNTMFVVAYPEDNCETDLPGGLSYYTYLMLSITLTVMVIVVGVMFGLCVYYGFISVRRLRSDNPARGRMEINDIPSHRPEDFNPLSPIAFFPPPYIDSDKDPPTYDEITGQLPNRSSLPEYSEVGNLNSAFVLENQPNCEENNNSNGLNPNAENLESIGEDQTNGEISERSLNSVAKNDNSGYAAFDFSPVISSNSNENINDSNYNNFNPTITIENNSTSVHFDI